MFTVEERNQIRDYVLRLAESDQRVVAGATIGSLALGEGDRWSDLDLTFGVADNVSMFDVLEDWTRDIIQKFDAALLFDLPAGPSIYRVFLFPGALQFDLSFTPAPKFGATGPTFKLLFGKAVEKPFASPPSAQELFGYAVHHVLRARFCIERGRFWQAEYWISSARDYLLNLACLRRGLPANNARGYDALPGDVLDMFKPSLVKSLEREELMRALSFVIDGMFKETGDVKELADKVEPHIRELTSFWES